MLHGVPVGASVGVSVDPPAAAAEEGVPFRLRLNAGGAAYVDSGGNTWDADGIGRGGRRRRRVYDVMGTDDDALFGTFRAGKLIRYTIPLPAPGVYGVNLLFAEPRFVPPGRRVFRVLAEDQPVLTDVDLAAAGIVRAAVVRSFAVLADDAMDIVFHGTVGKAIVSGIEVFQGESVPEVTAVWREGAPAPAPLFEAQGAAAGDKLYVFGGFFNEAVQATRAVNVYDPATNLWAPRADMPSPVTHAGVAADGATVWVVGGLTGDYNGGINPTTAEVWKYDTVADAWAAGPPLPAPRGAGGLALAGRRLHYFGGLGADGQSDSAQHWTLDVDDPAAQWQSAAPMPVPRNHFGTAVVDGRIYAAGGQHGRDETNGNLRDVHAYDPATDRWTALPRLPKPMSHFLPSTAAVNGKVVVAGGVTNGRVPLRDVWEFDPAARRWTAATPLPAPRKAPVMALVGPLLITVAGSPGDNFPQETTWIQSV